MKFNPLFHDLEQEHERFGLVEDSYVFLNCVRCVALFLGYSFWHGPEVASREQELTRILTNAVMGLHNLVPPNTNKDFAQKCTTLQFLSPRAAIEADYKLITAKMARFSGKTYNEALAKDDEVWRTSWAEFRRSILTLDGQDALLVSLEQRGGKIEDIARFRKSLENLWK